VPGNGDGILRKCNVVNLNKCSNRINSSGLEFHRINAQDYVPKCNHIKDCAALNKGSPILRTRKDRPDVLKGGVWGLLKETVERAKKKA
jgi:hypothetical protein